MVLARLCLRWLKVGVECGPDPMEPDRMSIFDRFIRAICRARVPVVLETETAILGWPRSLESEKGEPGHQEPLTR